MSTYVSTSLITEALVLLKFMARHNCFCEEDVGHLKVDYGINKKAALSMAKQCQWISVNDDMIAFTEWGKELVAGFDGSLVGLEMWRAILKQYISVCHPIWAKLIPYGRQEAYVYMSEEEQLCFQKAKLMTTPVAEDVIQWWDSIANAERDRSDVMKSATGRQGERLTIEYETARTGVDPLWKSIESNKNGYDVLSQRDRNNNSQILIEVKSSEEDISHAQMHVSRNEWDVASLANNQQRYYFYLWVVRDSLLAIVPYGKMIAHIPRDNGNGIWESVDVPFSAFTNMFEGQNCLMHDGGEKVGISSLEKS